ncbi:hypothetical protein Taro_040804 [Colocasia esculenta]|uniref:Uncharacterized protein n=1 Tax=Colocasia esculenta TaxID=4460 RepID=A0A843WU25_COLES|nr:hypothetical protein [Colocasia esculenta]
MTPAKTNGVRHKAEAVLSTPAETTEQPSENDVSPQAQPPQTATRSRAHKQNHPGPRTHHQVGRLHTSVPSQAGTQERDHGTERTLKREPPEARVCPRPDQRRPWKLGTTGYNHRASSGNEEHLETSRENVVTTTTTTKPPPLVAKRGTRSPRALLASLTPASTPTKGETEPPQKHTNSRNTAAWPSYGLTPGTTTWLRNNVERGSETKDCLVCARKELRTPQRLRPRQESSTNDSAPLSKPQSANSAANSSMLIA